LAIGIGLYLLLFIVSAKFYIGAPLVRNPSNYAVTVILVTALLESPQACNFTKFTVLRICCDFLLCSNWPTFPQVYMNGQLMGGADIMLQMHQSGEDYKSTTNQMLTPSQ